MKLEVIEFIKEHDNWKELLQQLPYSIIIKEDEDYYLLKYNQLDSDFSQRIVKECRGLIIRKKDLKPIALSFLKFHNYGEPNADKINWNNFQVYDKIDGSKILVFYDNLKWHIATSGNIDAYNAPVSNKDFSYGDLFEEACQYNGYESADQFLNTLDCNYCYTFELISPESPVIIDYPETDIYLIGVRNTTTFDEIDISDVTLPFVKRPVRYDIKSLDDCIKAAEELNTEFNVTKEGFVVCDNNYNRVKIKSPEYLKLHYLYGNGIMGADKALEIIENNEIEEVCAYFPRWREFLNNLMKNKQNYLKELEKERESLLKWAQENNIIWAETDMTLKDGSIIKVKRVENKNRKLIAEYINKEHKEYSSFLFEVVKDLSITINEFWNKSTKNFKFKILGLKEDTVLNSIEVEDE